MFCADHLQSVYAISNSLIFLIISHNELFQITFFYAGLIFPLRDVHTIVDVKGELGELEFYLYTPASTKNFWWSRFFLIRLGYREI